MKRNNHKEKLSSINMIASNPKKAYMVFAIIVILVFFQSLKFDFTYHDDLGLIRSKELTFTNAKLIFQKGVFYFTKDVKPELDTYYRPMQNIVYALGNHIGGRNIFIHHLIAILLHITASCLLYNFLIKIGYKHIIAFLTTVLFSVHPLLVQGVVWIPGLGELLITVFVLLSLIYLIKFIENEKLNLFHCFLSLLFFLLALFSKESAIGFIPVVLFYILFINKSRMKGYMRLLPFISGLILVIFSWYLLRQNAIGEYSIITISSVYESVLKNGSLLIYYIGKIFFPFSLSPLPSPVDSNFIPGVICLLALIISFFIVKGKRNYIILLFGLGWYVAFLLPAFFVKDLSHEFYSYNHRLYLPLIGFLLVILEVFALNYKDTNSKIPQAALLVPAMLFFVVSFNYSKAFKNKYSFYETAIENSPNSLLAYEGIGNIYTMEKSCDKALEIYKKASFIRPEVHAYYGNVGNIYSNCLGDIPNAIEWYQKALKVDSKIKSASNTAISLGNIYYMSMKKNGLAKPWYKKAIDIDSSQSFPMVILGNIYSEEKKTDSAYYWYSRVLVLDSMSTAALNGIGALKYNGGKYKEAIPYLFKLPRRYS